METANIIYNGELRTTATHVRSGTVVETDAPLDNQGRAERFSPSDLVATALGSCMLTIMGIKARDKGWKLEGTKVSIVKIMGTEPRRITGVKVVFDFPAELQLEEKDQKMLEHVAHNCPVAKSVHPDILQDVVFNW